MFPRHIWQPTGFFQRTAGALGLEIPTSQTQPGVIVRYGSNQVCDLRHGT